jgi:hypothetical protein
MKQLIKFASNYADEFDVEAFTVWDSEKTEQFFAIAEVFFDVYPESQFEVNFGTNEYLTFEGYEDFRNCFAVVNIEDSEAEVFQKYFYYHLPENPPEFGTCSGVFDDNMFLEEFFNLHDEGKLPAGVIEKLISLEPEFETWITMDT